MIIFVLNAVLTGTSTAITSVLLLLLFVKLSTKTMELALVVTEDTQSAMENVF